MDNYILRVTTDLFEKITNKEMSIFIIDRDDQAFGRLSTSDYITILNTDTEEQLNALIIHDYSMTINEIDLGYFDISKTQYTEDNIKEQVKQDHNINDDFADIEVFEFMLI